MLTIGVWVFIAMAWTLGLLLRRDAWAPASLSTAAFLDLSILRSRRRREAIVAQVVLYALILGFDLSWIYLRQPELVRAGVVAFLTSGGVAWVWGITAALAVVAVRQRRRLGRDRRTADQSATSARRFLESPATLDAGNRDLPRSLRNHVTYIVT